MTELKFNCNDPACPEAAETNEAFHLHVATVGTLDASKIEARTVDPFQPEADDA